MQQFLVPVDFSKASRNALNYAASLAKVMQARLLLFNAYMLPAPVSEVPYMMVTAEELQKQQEERMKEEALWLKEEWGLEAETVVRLGIASDEIRHLVKTRSVDLVVMGMKGEGGLDKMIGSTTTNVIRKIHTPVLVIPHNAVYQPPVQIVYATDYSYETGFHLFDPLLKLASSFSSQIRILNIQLDHGGEEPAILMGKKNIEQVFRGVSHEFVTETHRSVTQGINDHLVKHPSSLLVMVAHTHSFLERIFTKNHTTAMAYETHLPLLVLQDKP